MGKSNGYRLNRLEAMNHTLSSSSYSCVHSEHLDKIQNRQNQNKGPNRSDMNKNVYLRKALDCEV